FVPLLCRHPCSPLFPYTTLFRSPVLVGETSHPRIPRTALRIWRACRRSACPTSPIRRSSRSSHPSEPPDCRTFHWPCRNLPAGRDRKSTRLNSSHVKISYAVFCL